MSVCLSVLKPSRIEYKQQRYGYENILVVWRTISKYYTLRIQLEM